MLLLEIWECPDMITLARREMARWAALVRTALAEQGPCLKGYDLIQVAALVSMMDWQAQHLFVQAHGVWLPKPTEIEGWQQTFLERWDAARAGPSSQYPGWELARREIAAAFHSLASLSRHHRDLLTRFGDQGLVPPGRSGDLSSETSR